MELPDPKTLDEVPEEAPEEIIGKPSSKLSAITTEIKRVQSLGEKCVVFSQFLGFLSAIGNEMNKAGIKFSRVDGSMTRQARDKSILDFKSKSDFTVILISTKCGATSLNLTQANHALFVEPWWSPALEEQAVMRIHRIG